jgi:hypothetical protein
LIEFFTPHSILLSAVIPNRDYDFHPHLVGNKIGFLIEFFTPHSILLSAVIPNRDEDFHPNLFGNSCFLIGGLALLIEDSVLL